MSASAADDERRRKAEHPQCSAAEAVDIALELFGLEAEPDLEENRRDRSYEDEDDEEDEEEERKPNVFELDSYDDRNFHIKGSLAGEYGVWTLKVHNGVESDDHQILDAQNKLLEHMAKHKINCPEPVTALPKEEEAEEEEQQYDEYADEFEEDREANHHLGGRHSVGRSATQRKAPNTDQHGQYVEPLPTQIGYTDLALQTPAGISFKRHAVRLLSWVDGTPMNKVESPSEILYHKAGRYLAELDTVLESFDHHAAHRTHSWDLLNTGSLRGFVDVIDDPERYEVVCQVVDRFEQIADFQSHVPWQVLHADFNNANVILKDLKEDERLEKEAEWRARKKEEKRAKAQGHHGVEQDNRPKGKTAMGNKRNKSRRDKKPYHQADWVVNGVIDVGDIVYSCRVNDLAIGIAYMLIAAISDTREVGSVSPVDAAAAFYGGFASRINLNSAEKSALHTLVACRLAISYTYGMFSYSMDPANEYLLMHAEPAYDALSLWWQIPEDEVMKIFSAALVKNAYR